jgi:hypothetical protein
MTSVKQATTIPQPHPPGRVRNRTEKITNFEIISNQLNTLTRQSNNMTFIVNRITHPEIFKIYVFWDVMPWWLIHTEVTACRSIMLTSSGSGSPRKDTVHSLWRTQRHKPSLTRQWKPQHFWHLIWNYCTCTNTKCCYYSAYCTVK